ncbi:MAG: hypothetical protein WAK17_16875 [Candidatus Nitrosopolaris sp.]|jgi:hypothetical protein
MFESIAYIGPGFVTAFLSLEAGWHFVGVALALAGADATEFCKIGSG